MQPRISIITLGVSDLARSLTFYRDGLSLPTTWEAERGIVFFQTLGTALALYPYDELAKDVGEEYQGKRCKFPGVTLAHNVRTKQEVDSILIQVEKAGAMIVKPAADTFWGGYSGYFSDPDGYLWEVAYGAFEFKEDGSLLIP